MPIETGHPDWDPTDHAQVQQSIRDAALYASIKSDLLRRGAEVTLYFPQHRNFHGYLAGCWTASLNSDPYTEHILACGILQ